MHIAERTPTTAICNKQCRAIEVLRIEQVGFVVDCPDFKARGRVAGLQRLRFFGVCRDGHVGMTVLQRHAADETHGEHGVERSRDGHA